VSLILYIVIPTIERADSGPEENAMSAKEVHFGRMKHNTGAVYRGSATVGYIVKQEDFGDENRYLVKLARTRWLQLNLPIKITSSLSEARSFSRFVFASQENLAPIVGHLVTKTLAKEEPF